MCSAATTKGQEGVVAGLRRGHAVEAQLFAFAGRGGDAADVGRRLALAGVLVGVGAQDHGLDSERHGHSPIASDAAM